MKIGFVAFLMVLFFTPVAQAEGWSAHLESNSFGPEKFVAIDKDGQTIFLMARKSPLSIEKEFSCTTGQVVGDKQERGDLRTPEGVYFIGRRIQGSLDYELYGDFAFSLNYPNPIDKLNGKTGSGIWLHGRGKELVPRDTRGCVALAQPDLDILSQAIEPDLPVIIARGLDMPGTFDQGGSEVDDAVNAIKSWAENWQARSDDFFDHYDWERFPLTSGENENGFTSHKKAIFASQPWIDVVLDNIHAVQGPGYWVVWFDQFYRTPNMTSTVGKRFYLQRGEDDKLRIVGREYVTPVSADMTDIYLELKKSEIEPLIRNWLDAWGRADQQRYASFYAENALQGKRRGRENIVKYKKELWAEKPPVDLKIDEVDFALHPRGLQVSFFQDYKDITGYADKGYKTLVFAPDGDNWLIVNEQWRSTR